jgi:hypothetical protein
VDKAARAAVIPIRATSMARLKSKLLCLQRCDVVTNNARMIVTPDRRGGLVHCTGERLAFCCFNYFVLSVRLFTESFSWCH